MSDQAHPTTERAAAKGRGRTVLIWMLGVVGGAALFMWSFVLPILGIIHLVEMLG